VPELAQALGRLVADRGLRARMGAAGMARARLLYDEARVVSRTLDLLGLRDYAGGEPVEDPS
jgi:glycosyltransferase involved in cell wall biosynthesis